MERYVCIHGHFYQPPRENPWLEAIELQVSAYPYHDWNERITAECYEPNASSRILDEEGRIVMIVNNYAHVSSNVGPTLLSWMEYKAPSVYQAIVDVDGESQGERSGHGNALAQPYNHLIMPLANGRDKHTQALWGIRDFEHRFGRRPEGMWLPETAVDLETLEVLSELGIRFTILAPHQAGRVRPMAGGDWQDVGGGTIDPSMPYELRLPSGRSMALFFYNESIARAVAFEGLLSSGDAFARRIEGAFSGENERPQLVHIATDGETYGHHHRHGDMALAYALHSIESHDIARITNYAEYLDRYPPTHEVEIVENTSWSCTHGVERWRSNCGCNAGRNPRWNQAWREPLRRAMDWLRDQLAPRFEEKGKGLLKDPWAARDDYIWVILDRSPESVERFLGEHAARPLNEAEKIEALKLLELQRQAMLMFTSCGWFFDELSGLETVQVIQYAGRAIQLATELFGDDIEEGFLKLLEEASSNIRAYGNGRRIYERFVRPAMVDLPKVAAHWAVNSLFEGYNEQARAYCYVLDIDDYVLREAGRVRLAMGRVHVSSEITHESADLCFGLLHFGDHNLSGGVRAYQGDDAYRAMVHEVQEVFDVADFPEVVRLIDRHFGSSSYSLRNLFRDEQRKALEYILESTLSDIEAVYRGVFDQNCPLMRFLADLGQPLPRAFRAAAEFILNIDLRRAFEEEDPDIDRVSALLDSAEMWQVEMDTAGLGYALEHTIERLSQELLAQPTELALLQRLAGVVGMAQSLPFDPLEVDFAKAQNAYYRVLQSTYPQVRDGAERVGEEAEAWLSLFRELGERLSVWVE